MYKLLLLFVVITNLFSFTDAQEKRTEEKTKAILSNEVGLTTDEHIHALLDSFLIELNNDPNAQGHIINYGTEREILRLEKSIMNYLRFRRFDTSRIVPIRGGFLNKRKTQFWIVPAGTESPQLIPTARKIDEFSRLSKTALRARLKKIREILQKNLANSDTVYIVIVFQFKNNAEARSLEASVQKYLFEDCRDCFGLSPRFTMIREEQAKTPKVQFWIVPMDAEMPQFTKE